MLFSFSLLSFLLCTSVAATSPRGSPEPVSDSKHEEEMELPFPHMETRLVDAIQLSGSSYKPVGPSRPVIGGQPIQLISFYSDHPHSLDKISVKTTKARARVKEFRVSELTEGDSPWLTEGKWELTSGGPAEPPREIYILWQFFNVVQHVTPAFKLETRQFLLVVQDATPASTLERAKFDLPVVNKEGPLKTGVRLSIASTTIIPSGTTYISFYHHDPIRKYLTFNNDRIVVGDKYRRDESFLAATLDVEATNGPVLCGRWKREIFSSTGPAMLQIYTNDDGLYYVKLDSAKP